MRTQNAAWLVWSVGWTDEDGRLRIQDRAELWAPIADADNVAEAEAYCAAENALPRPGRSAVGVVVADSQYAALESLGRPTPHVSCDCSACLPHTY